MATSLKFKFPQVGQNNYLIVTWAENSAPNLEKGRQVYAPGDGPGQARGLNVLVPENMNKVVYSFRFWESSNGANLERMLDDWAVDFTVDGVAAFQTIWYEVDRGHGSAEPPIWQDPVSGGNISLRDQRLAGKKYDVYQRGTGLRTEGVEWIDRTDEGGGFDLVNEQFQPEDIWWVQINNTIRTSGGTAAPAGEYDIVEIDQDTNLTEAHFNCLIHVKGNKKVVVLGLPPFQNIPDHTKMKFVTEEFTGNNVVLSFGGSQVAFMGQLTNQIELGRGEMYEIKWKGNKGYTMDKKGVWDQVGNTVMCDILPLSSELADRHRGQTSDYPRLMKRLTPDMMCTPEQRDSNPVLRFIAGQIYIFRPFRGKFCVDGEWLYFPDYREASFRVLTAFDGTEDPNRLTQGPGGFMPRNILKHDHPFVLKALNFKNDNGQRVDLSVHGTDGHTYRTDISGGDQNVDDNFGKYAATII